VAEFIEVKQRLTLFHAPRLRSQGRVPLLRVTSRRRLPPPAMLALALLRIISLGTVLLRLPIAHTGATISWLDKE